jgi:hypothetical protein
MFQREWTDWLLGVVVVMMLFAGAWAMLGGFDKAGTAEDEAAVAYTPEEEWAPPTEASIPRPATITARTPDPTSVVTIYECVEGGQKVLTDRPCGPGATVRTIDTRGLNTYTETPMPQSPETATRSTTSTSAGATPRLDVGAADRAKTQLCESLQERIDYINTRTRQRHTHREGEYWRAEWHKAKNAYYDARCGR